LLGFSLGVGVNYRKYSAEVRYEIANGMSDFPVLKSRTRRYSILFGYRLYSKKTY